MQPKISVIIPVYNAEKYVGQTIESVLAQTCQNFEILAVDDGSSDGSLHVLRGFEPRVRVLSKPNGGPASARNLAIINSGGEYLAFLDCDDLWMEEKLAEQTAYLDSHPEIGLLFTEALMFVEEGGRKIVRDKIGYTADPTFRQLLYGDYIPNSTVIIRRSCVDRVGLLNESRDLIAVEDYEYWMRIAREFKLAGIPKPLAYYRLRDGNLMGDGQHIDRGLRLSLAAIGEIENRYPQMWKETGVDRELLMARLHIRAGFAWKRRGDWSEAVRWFARALTFSVRPRVWRWIAAASILPRWS